MKIGYFLSCEEHGPRELVRQARGDDLEDHVEELRQVRAAGFDEVYVSQIGPEQDGFFRFYAEQVLPKVR